MSKAAVSINYTAYSQGYQVVVMDDKGEIIDDYMAGNSKRCSQSYVDPEKGETLETLWRFAEQSAKEMADKHKLPHSEVYRDNDAVEGLEASALE